MTDHEDVATAANDMTEHQREAVAKPGPEAPAHPSPENPQLPEGATREKPPSTTQILDERRAQEAERDAGDGDGSGSATSSEAPEQEPGEPADS